jgi:glycerol-3-phosphate dehydrogenase
MTDSMLNRAATPAGAAFSVGLPARERAWHALASRQFDLLVIGGGITGAGIAREAALRGLAVAIVDADDWASGTSSRSSRLVHGGVRYLEHGHFHLVFESSRERRTLLTIAPHLVRPLAFTWPVYVGARVPRWKLRAGLFLYDVLALFRNVGNHRGLSSRQVVKAEPALRAVGLRGGAQYFDAATDDMRLTLANIVAAAEAGAVALNHAPVTGLLHDGAGRVRGAQITDVPTGESIAVTARVVVNATGPWSDSTRRLDDGIPHAEVLGSKGVHIAVPKERVPVHGALTLIHPDDGRVFFIIPSAVTTIIGTTETAADAGPAQVRATMEDVRYLLRAANHFVPTAGLGESDVISAWAGLRPLVAQSGTSANAASREHALATSRAGLLSITGGKLTTFRAMGEEVVDAVERALGRARSTPSTTADVPLPGATRSRVVADEERAATEAIGFADTAAHLVRAYGDRWSMVWELVRQEPSLGDRLEPSLPYLRAEVVWAAAAEGAWTVADVLVRRMPVAYERYDAGRALADDVARLLGRAHGWDYALMAEAAAAYDAEAARLFSVRTS